MLIHYLKLMRLHKPIGISLLLWPTLWALWLAAQTMPSLKTLSIFIAGVIVMRSAGCIVNDIADRHIDKHVKRTANRPITSGEVSVPAAISLLSILLTIALILVLQLNFLTIKLALVALLLAIIYPFTKRWTYWPQLFLGAAFAMSVPMAFAALLNHLPLNSWLVFSIAVLWPLMYDTEYAMVDSVDDRKIGVKSTALLFGKYNILAIALLQALIVGLWIWLGIIYHLSVIYFIAVGIAALMFIYQLWLIQSKDDGNYFRAFLNNQWVGLIVFLGIAIPHHVPYWDAMKHFVQ